LAEAICDALLEASSAAACPLTEQVLADRFGVSRTPVREILSRLEDDGIIERRQRKGIQLRRPSPKELVELYDLRALLEGYAARHVALRATPDDIEHLAACAECFTRCRKDGDDPGCEEANIQFHHKLVALAGNDLLRKIMDRFNIIRRAFRITHGLPADARDRDTPYPHEDLVEMIRQGNADACEAFMQAHILRAKDILLQKVLGFRLALDDGRQAFSSRSQAKSPNRQREKDTSR